MIVEMVIGLLAGVGIAVPVMEAVKPGIFRRRKREPVKALPDVDEREALEAWFAEQERDTPGVTITRIPLTEAQRAGLNAGRGLLDFAHLCAQHEFSRSWAEGIETARAALERAQAEHYRRHETVARVTDVGRCCCEACDEWRRNHVMTLSMRKRPSPTGIPGDGTPRSD